MNLSHTRSISVLAVISIVAIAGACGGGDSPSPSAGSLDGVKESTVYVSSQGEMRDFGGAESEPGLGSGTGSGFIIDQSGLVVTNNHVVTGGGSLKVRTAGSDDEIPAKVVGVSECNDLALLQLTDDTDYPALKWSNEPAEPPLEVYAAGFPLGDPEYTLTKGAITKAEANGQTAWASVRSVVEHDAVIQPGNSGGPLVNADGAVVGVNYASGSLDAPTLQSRAINGDRAQGVIEKLRNGDDESIGLNGEAFVDEDAGLAGVWVRGVAPGGIAADAGIKPGDIISALDGVPLAQNGTMEEYCDVLRSNNPDDTMSLRVLRIDTEEELAGELNGKELTPAVVPGGPVEPDPEEPPAEPSDPAVEIVDDTESMLVRVPSSWSDTATAPQDTNGDGQPEPYLKAAPSIEALDSDAGPGVIMNIVPAEAGETIDGLLDIAAQSSGCDETDRSEYADAVFTGRILQLSCDSTLKFLLVATPPDDPTVFFEVYAAAVTDADVQAISDIFASFNVS